MGGATNSTPSNDVPSIFGLSLGAAVRSVGSPSGPQARAMAPARAIPLVMLLLDITTLLSAHDARRPGRSTPGRSSSRSCLVAQIVVCADVAVRQGRLRRHSPARELMLYVVHGLLHLMGYDHATARAAACIHAREDELLTAFGVGPAFAPSCPQRPT